MFSADPELQRDLDTVVSWANHSSLHLNPTTFTWKRCPKPAFILWKPVRMCGLNPIAWMPFPQHSMCPGTTKSMKLSLDVVG